MITYIAPIKTVMEERSFYGTFYSVQIRSLCFWLGADGEA